MLYKRLLTKVRHPWGLTALSLLIGIGGCYPVNQTNQAPTATPSAITATNASNTSNLAITGESRPIVVTTNAVVCGLTQKIAADTVDLKCLVAPDADPISINRSCSRSGVCLSN